MSRKLKFDEDSQNPNADPTANDTIIKPKRKQKFQHDETPQAGVSDVKPQSSAATNETIGAALAPSGEQSTAGSVGDALNVGTTHIQQGTANILRNITPDETPDRNTAVSATRFSFEVGANVLSQMTANPRKRKSKLQAEKSRLKFEEQNGTDDNKSNEQAQNGNEPDQNEPTDTEVDGVNGTDGGDTSKSDSNETQSNDSPASDNPTATSDDNANTNDILPENENPDTPHNPQTDTANDTKPLPKSTSTTEQSKADSTADPDTASTKPPPTADNSNSKLQFTKDEAKVTKLEKKADKLGKKLDNANDKLPTKKVKKKQLVFDEKKGKSVTKLTHEKEKIPIGEAKWNKPKEKSMPTKAVGVVTSMTVTKVHAKVHQVEHENVGVKVAHQAELLGESAYRGTKKTAISAYRFHKNSPYRRVAKLEQKSIKNKMKLDYRKALRDNPKLKSNPVSRFFQKRAIKRNYAKDIRNAKNAAKTGQKALGITAKAGKIVTAIIRKNPIFLLKAGLLLLIIFLLLSLLTMCVGMFSGTSAFVGAVSYAAEYEDISDSSVLYTELETDLRIYINDIESNYPDYDEYRFNIDSIGHDPFALIAFLTAVYQDFTFAEVEATIRAIFEAQYTLELVSEMEIRTRTEERIGTGSWTDSEGNTHTYTYTYTVIVEYEWHILNVNLTSRSFTDVLLEMMDDDQTQHFHVLMYSKGARQFVGNPFEFDWRPFVTSLYGYRIHPIDGGKQFHWGLDIGLPEGTPLLAGLDGVVVAVGYQPNGYGNFVVIECADGNQVRYAHCHEVFVTEGQTVERGDVIATVGNTGASTGAHLHIEVSRNGQRINPIFFMEFR